jgi:hypothetical protein
MVKTLLCCAALAGAMFVLAGCATIVYGTTEKVQIDSNPDGADVVIDDSQHLTTPAQIKLARGSAHKLVFHKAGYQDDTENLTSSTSGWILGNLIGGGVVGMAIDASDGAGRKLSSDNVNVTLMPARAQTPVPLPAAQARAPSPTAQAHEVRPVASPDPAYSEKPPRSDYTDDEADFAAPARDAGSQQ